MPLASSGTISLSQVQTEFGGTNPISMSEYYTNAVSGFTSGITGLPSSGTTVSLSVFRGKAKTQLPIPTEIVVAGTTSTTIGTNERYILFPYSGSGTTKDYTFTTTEDLLCDILIVGGGGGGGNYGGGGGGGDVIQKSNFLLSSGTFSISVGTGGAGGVNPYNKGANGTTSSITSSLPSLGLFAAGGGGGGGYNQAPATTPTAGSVVSYNYSSGGGGGGGAGGLAPNNGETGNSVSGNGGSSGSQSKGGGGGGASGNGTSATASGAGNGGSGVSSLISGTATNYGGGGGGGTWSGGTFGIGVDGGGNGAVEGSGVNPVPGTRGGGGGGGGGSTNTGGVINMNGANGGSGVVIIRYRRSPTPTEIVVVGTTSTTIGNERCLVFPYSGSGTTKDYTFTTTQNLICDVLVVGGGGGGGNDRGGGGGGGGLVFKTGIALNATSINVSVGRGGFASVNDTTTGGNGVQSSYGTIIALGGGGGGSEQTNANNGGSGGGSAYNYSYSHFGTGDQPTSASSGYGNRGGDARDLSQSTTNRGCGGGGGAGTRGLEATSLVGGAGGDGLAGVGSIDFKTYFNLPINNTIGQYISQEDKVYFAGGGGGGDCVDGTANPSIHGLGGKGGGANGTTTANTRGTVFANSGGGGGGGTLNLPIGSDGGSGVVIIKYRLAPHPYLLNNYAPQTTGVAVPYSDLCTTVVTSTGQSAYDNLPVVTYGGYNWLLQHNFGTTGRWNGLQLRNFTTGLTIFSNAQLTSQNYTSLPSTTSQIYTDWAPGWSYGSAYGIGGFNNTTNNGPNNIYRDYNTLFQPYFTSLGYSSMTNPGTSSSMIMYIPSWTKQVCLVAADLFRNDNASSNTRKNSYWWSANGTSWTNLGVASWRGSINGDQYGSNISQDPSSNADMMVYNVSTAGYLLILESGNTITSIAFVLLKP